MKIAKERKSSVLASNAVHHRIDSLTSIVALVAIVGSNVFHNVSWLDPVGGLIVSMMVIRAGWGNTGNALLELSDVGVATDIVDSIRKATANTLTEVSLASGKVEGSKIEVQDVQGVKAGQNYLMDIQLAVPSDWSVDETHHVESLVRERVGAKVRGVRRVRIRFVSKTSGTLSLGDEFISKNVSPSDIPDSDDEKQCKHDEGHGTKSNGAVKRRH